MIINKRLKILRTENKLTQLEFGKLFNLAESTISLYESGKRIPENETLFKISQHFNVTVDWIMGLADERKFAKKEFVPSNINLIKGNMSWEEMSLDIAKKMNNPSMGEHFNPKYLQSIASGSETPTYPRISGLAIYADVDPDFFYRHNTKEDFEMAKEKYLAEKEKRHVTHFDKDLQDFINNPASKEYIELAKKIFDKGWDAKEVEVTFTGKVRL